MSLTITLPPRIARRIRREAEKRGVSPEELIIDILGEDMDPRDNALDYIEAALLLLEQAREELERGDARQAAEKLWGAAALAVKAYAAWRDGKRLASHKELWMYKRIMSKELGEWVHDAWMNATGMYTCFYENWCGKEDVEDALKRIEKLVKAVMSKVEEKY